MKPEEILQINLMNWIEAHTAIRKFVFHIPNERQCHVMQGRKLKRMGVKSGVSDLFIAVPVAPYHGMFLELKTESGKLSDNQEAFLADMRRQGYWCEAAFGYERAKVAIQNYLQNASLPPLNTAHPEPFQSPQVREAHV